jgi:hypothetical protein
MRIAFVGLSKLSVLTFARSFTLQEAAFRHQILLVVYSDWKIRVLSNTDRYRSLNRAWGFPNEKETGAG